MANRKTWIVVGVVFLLIISIGLLIEQMAYTSSKIGCAKITRKSAIRGAWSVHYEFEVDGEIMEGGIETGFLKKISLDSLKKIECIKIEYSNYSTFFNRVIDKRILK
jgi:hypothetical protein